MNTRVDYIHQKFESEEQTAKRLSAIVIRWESEAGSVSFHPIRVVFSGFCFILSLVSKKKFHSPFGFGSCFYQSMSLKGSCFKGPRRRTRTNTGCQL